MGKKKNRGKKNKENEAEESGEEGISTCPHIAKAVNFAAMRKVLVKPVCKIGECTSCNLGTGKGQRKGKGEDNTAAVVEQDCEEDQQTTIWVCLQCGHQGCDRNSQEKHALKHYNAPRCGIHCLVINLTTWATWCYACDDEVPLESRRIQECMEFLRKQVKTLSQGHPQSANENSNQNFTQTNHQSDGGSLSTSSSTATSGHPVVITPQISAKSSSDLVCHKVKGLSNLGNTCFFNAVMQNMCQTPGIEALLGERCQKDFTLSVAGWYDEQKDSDLGSDSEEEEECSRVRELSPISVEMGEPGPLSMALTNFVREMNVPGGKSTVSPSTLFGNICKKAPRFRGFQQQDSHELLRYLVDAVRNEEIKRAQGGILRHFKMPEQVVDEDLKRNIKGYGLPIKFTFVDSLFGGQLVSTITCEECSHVSQIIESFLDLSLPVTEEKLQRSNQMLGGRNKESVSPAVGREVEEDSPPLKGVDGFAARSGKPSKYQERKNKKHAKKEAKKKGRGQHAKNRLGLKKNNITKEEEEEEEEINEGEAEAEEDGEKEKPAGADSEKVAGLTDQGQAKSSAPDGDTEDNADSETPRLQMIAGDNHNNNNSSSSNSSNSNSSNLAQERNLQDLQNLSIKAGTEKELHILPKYLESDSYTASSSVEARGIKEGKPCEVKELANNIRRLTIDDSGVGRTEGASDETSAEDRGRREEVESEKSFSSPEVCHSVAADQKQASHNGEVDCIRTENECKEPALTTEDITLCFDDDDDSPKHNSGDSAAAHNSSPCDSENIYHPQKQGATDTVRTDRYKEARHKAKATLSARYQSSAKECSVKSCLNQFTSAELLTGPNKVKCKACTKARPVETLPQTDKKKTLGVYSVASKQYLILAPPAVLTLHLKRFEQVGFGCRKVNRHVEFPLLLDLAPYCSALCQEVRRGQRQVLYSLYGLVEHSGRLHGGHYTAFVKVRPGVGPGNNFLRSQPLKSHDFIHRLMEQMPNGMDSPESEDNETPAARSSVPEGRWFHISDSSVGAVAESRVLSAQAYLLFYERIF